VRGIYPLGWCGIKRRKRGLVGVTRLSASWTRVEIVVVSILLSHIGDGVSSSKTFLRWRVRRFVIVRTKVAG
jgi:hypothetical protein